MSSAPTALGPNFKIVEQRVKKYAELLAKRAGLTIRRFSACEPWDHQIQTVDGEEWLEAWFALRVEGRIPSSQVMNAHRRKTIEIFAFEYSGDEYTNILMSARVIK